MQWSVLFSDKLVFRFRRVGAEILLDPHVQVILNTELRDGHAVLFGDRANHGIAERRSVSDGRIRLNDDSLALAVVDQFKGRFKLLLD